MNVLTVKQECSFEYAGFHVKIMKKQKVAF